MSTESAYSLLKKLIGIPSLSREEHKTADLLAEFLNKNGCDVNRIKNNIISTSALDSNKPTLLLNSHHDTVKPNEGWKTDPFRAVEENGKLIGLGSNDAGASVVCLTEAFLQLKEETLPFNLVLLLSAEEEISGKNGVELALQSLPAIDFGIVGEPTEMKVASSEKGLVVIDAYSKGKSGHAARDEGVNALYIALEDIEKIRNFTFENSSLSLGPVKLSVTQINAGSQHNVVPDTCHFVIDVRTNELYSNTEIVELLASELNSELAPRSTRLNSSGLPLEHPAWNTIKKLGLETYGSPTLSDQALMSFPTIKMGPGESARSHTAGEYILKKEIQEGINGYIRFISNLELT